MDQVDLEDLEDPGDRKIKTIEAKNKHKNSITSLNNTDTST